MSAMKHLLAALLLLAAALTLGASKAEACTCEIDRHPQTESEMVEIVKRERDSATAVFAGTVVLEETFRVTLEVERAWKGALARNVSMRTGNIDNGDGTTSIDTCAAAFKNGQKYIVFAFGPLTDLRATSCTLTSVLGHASDTVQRLDDLAERERHISKSLPK
jgi:hypothetical protein